MPRFCLVSIILCCALVHCLSFLQNSRSNRPAVRGKRGTSTCHWRNGEMLHGSVLSCLTASVSPNIIEFEEQDSATEGWDKLTAFIDGLVVQGNTTQTLLNMIQLGDSFALEQNLSQDDQGGGNEVKFDKESESSESDINNLSFYRSLRGQNWQRVPGCMADARLWTVVDEHDKSIRIGGVSDSRVAQGLLALLGRGLQGTDAESCLSLDAQRLTERCGLAKVLPPGRLNGLQNMLGVAQAQVRLQLGLIASGVRSGPGMDGGELEREERLDQLKLVGQSSSASEDTPDTASLEARAARGEFADEVAVLLSGGVDSSVALALLQEQGVRVRAFYLKIWLEDEVAHLNECPWEEDLSYAQAVCDQLGVPLETVSLQREYWDQVVQYTFDEARLGRTPNPDIMCNSRVKFGTFFEHVGRHFKKVATGHYAQVLPLPVGEGLTFAQKSDVQDVDVHLALSPDQVKDQTYFLCNLRQDQLRRALFPIGHLQKSEVRAHAERLQLPNRKRKDSQGICFLGKLKFNEFISHYLGDSPGDIREQPGGESMGTHRGLWYHTIGQRKGVGLRLRAGVVNRGPWYVSAKDPEENVLYVTSDLSSVDLPRKEFAVGQLNWINGKPDFLADGQVRVRLRHGPSMARGLVRTQAAGGEDVGDKDEELWVTLQEKDKGIAPGQFAAFYDTESDVCLGAGVIVRTAVDAISGI